METSYKKTGSFIFRLLRVVVVLAIAIALAKLLISLKQEPDKKQIINTPPSVKVLLATPVSKVMTVDAYGTVKPRKQVKIAMEVPGRIDLIHPSFIEGGLIQKGDILIGIDQRSYELEVQTGEVRVRQAKIDIASLKKDIENLKNDIELSRANVSLAQKELTRITALTKNQFASKTSLDKAEQQHLQAKIGLQNISNRLSLTGTLMDQKNAALAMARVNLKKAELSLLKTRIISEFNGFVLDKSCEVGEYINPGQLLGSIYQKGSLDVDVRIPLEKMKWIESLFEDGKTPEARVSVANFDSETSYVWKAKVARVKSKIDEKTRTLPMTLEIMTPDVKIKNLFDLKPGTFVKCSIQGERYDNIFVLPRHLLKNDNTLFTVSDGHLKMKKVTILRKFEEEIFINAGLNPDDKIVVSPLPGALDGMALTLRENGK